MTVKDEGWGVGVEQARTEGFICSRRRKERGVYVFKSLMSCLQQLVNKSEVRWGGSDWFSNVAMSGGCFKTNLRTDPLISFHLIS